jgi:hypothetical protein
MAATEPELDANALLLEGLSAMLGMPVTLTPQPGSFVLSSLSDYQLLTLPKATIAQVPGADLASRSAAELANVVSREGCAEAKYHVHVHVLCAAASDYGAGYGHVIPCNPTFSVETIALAVVAKLQLKVPANVHPSVVFEGRLLDPTSTLQQSDVECCSTLHLRVPPGAGSSASVSRDIFARAYDFDFTGVDDAGKEYRRGGLPYFRPCGWHRYALNVEGKFDGGNNTWLGADNSEGEWAVCYHPSTLCQAAEIKRAVPRLLGRGGQVLFGAPRIEVAAEFSPPLRSCNGTGKRFNVIFQSRVSPKAIARSMDSSQTREFWFFNKEEFLRPYSLLIKQCR